MKHFALACLGAASLTACSGDNTSTAPDKGVLMQNDFENLAGWIPDAANLSKEKAHSGQYSIKVDKDNEYSITYRNLLGQLSPSRIRGVRVDAWAFTPEKNTPALLKISLNKTAGGEPAMTESIDLASQVKEPGKWEKVSKEIVFPANTNYSSQLVVYLWRADGGSTAYIDDVVLTALP